ncbi:leucine-rich repeat, immunoglobulin-like domain and transmembrane domain-containing protein 3b [Hippocampus zosterae]|uniref:leucine-rich repeat, immunoglobulin-like domain and transmembrane domain-containing protein 3b n=1 Tax=Hippocampus zosterae TaxID=109293 RepID=UPI00223D3821|nr:leucine-rich repeat, immunoglobulin-like domain and transmembrane domain-containing protein 3b [Hippocampus zosterae]XP_051941756.1 leucine-rich repeat, immunoglobulin-like domain and transmembrane domain-containing protein 3b [Hippocampus zosterae]
MHLLAFLHIPLYHFLVVHSCPSICTCIYGTTGTADLRLVQCSDPRISNVPINIPADTVKLRLEKTLITRVPRAAFFNLSELLFLWLTYNYITTIHPSSFVNLRVLRELRLDGNLLTTFPWEGLRDMPRLQTLGLHNNQLSSLPSQAALFLPNITYLDLSSNRLTMLSAELLDLWFPLLGQLQRSPQRRVLGLHDNPWMCDCQIALVVSLSMSLGSPVVLMDQLVTCSRSLGQSGMLLTKVELPHCMRPSIQPAATRVTSLRGSNVILRCVATGYPTPTLTWVKISNYADCCRQDITGDNEHLPRKLESSMQGSPRVGVRWSIISLDDLGFKDTGEYRCQARNMAGKSEAPVKLKVVGVTRLSRLPKKSQKTPPKSTSNSKKLNQNRTTSLTPSLKDNQLPRAIAPPTQKNNTQTLPVTVSKVLPIYKPSKTNLKGPKKMTKEPLSSL